MGRQASGCQTLHNCTAVNQNKQTNLSTCLHVPRVGNDRLTEQPVGYTGQTRVQFVIYLKLNWYNFVNWNWNLIKPKQTELNFNWNWNYLLQIKMNWMDLIEFENWLFWLKFVSLDFILLNVMHLKMIILCLLESHSKTVNAAGLLSE